MSLYPIELLNDPDCQYDTLLGPVTKLALAAASAK